MTKKELEDIYLEKRILILSMKGEPQYVGKVGIVNHIDDALQLHGTWGGVALIVNEDLFIVIDD